MKPTLILCLLCVAATPRKIPTPPKPPQVFHRHVDIRKGAELLSVKRAPTLGLVPVRPVTETVAMRVMLSADLFMITNEVVGASFVSLEWHGGEVPFQVQWAPTGVGPWTPIGNLTINRSATTQRPRTNAFFRIQGSVPLLTIHTNSQPRLTWPAIDVMPDQLNPFPVQSRTTAPPANQDPTDDTGWTTFSQPVPAAGPYSFQDTTSPNPTIWYRIKQKTVNGVVVPFNVVNISKVAPGSFGWVQIATGSGGQSQATSVAIDSQGNRYMGGWATGGTVNFGTGNIPTGTIVKDIAMIIAKYDKSGNLVTTGQWPKVVVTQTSSSIVGNHGPRILGQSISIDSKDNVIVGGDLLGTSDFSGTGSPGATVTSKMSASDAFALNAFVCKYGSDGSFKWVKLFGGTASDTLMSLFVNSSDDVVALGRFTSQSADYGNGWTLSASGAQSIFIMRVSGVDGSTSWAHAHGGAAYNQPNVICGDKNGDFLTSGFYTSGSSDFGGGSRSTSGSSGFLAKYHQVDGSYVWDHTVAQAPGWSVATDPITANIILGGAYTGTPDFGGGKTFDTLNNGGLFLAGYDVNGNCQWVMGSGSSSTSDTTFSIVIDALGSIFATGHQASGLYFPGMQQTIFGNAQWYASWSINGANAPVFRWASAYSATSSGAGYGIAVDSSQLLTSGIFGGTEDFGNGIQQNAGPTYSAAFIVQYAR